MVIVLVFILLGVAFLVLTKRRLDKSLEAETETASKSEGEPKPGTGPDTH